MAHTEPWQQEISNKIDTAVKAVTDSVNSFSFDADEFTQKMSQQHRTLQQSFTRLCLKWLEHCSTQEYKTDLRNQASASISKEIVDEFAKSHDGYKPSQYIPMI